MAENVRVAVRVRPFNSREKTRNSVQIIKMIDKSTEIVDPSQPDAEPKRFAFDYSYWSHDGFEEQSDGYLSPTTPNYADQKRVFDDLGRGVLDNAWKGYNCSLFAYGQTGSGKSYSMVGYGVNRGIVPVTCDELFKGIEAKRADGYKAEFQVSLSMLEIYNEQVRDLLNPKSWVKGGLKVRQHPKKGFYVEQLQTVAVNSYKEIDQRIEEGTRNRTVASTNMNATSSRAHTIVGILFSQKKKNDLGQETTTTSIINLVDLAGSERAESTGATGDRLKEGAAINQSLSTLGNVIKALADQSMGKKAVIVPYRDSVLTKLLKNALGGNSKTIMIAALSPADINYDETLSTLRFADRAKAIKTSAVINESPTEKLIRELREENQKLLDMLKKGGVGTGSISMGASEEEREKIRRELQEELQRQLSENQHEMTEMKKSWQEKLRESESAYAMRDDAEKKLKEEREKVAHFWNLNEDPQLTKMVFHMIHPGTHRIGSKKADPLPDIILQGLSILPQHASVSNEGSSIVLQPGRDAKVLVNGERVVGEMPLHHNDRVMFGSSHLYVLHHPKELAAAVKADIALTNVTYDMAQQEIAKYSGFDVQTEGKSKEDVLLMEDLVALVPMVNEANAISEELNKRVFFEIALISPQARGLKDGRTEVKVKMRNLVTEHEWMWSRNKFLNRKYLMQEMYQNFVEGEDWDLPPEKDPFYEDPETEVLIGSVQVYLRPLTYMIEFDENLSIQDFRGNEQGRMEVFAAPLTDDGREATDEDDLFIDEPSELIGEKMAFAVRIVQLHGLPAKFQSNIYCKYKFYLDEEPIVTPKVSGTNSPPFNFVKRFTYQPVTQQLLDYLTLQNVVIEVWGQQSVNQTNSRIKKKWTTSELVEAEKEKTQDNVTTAFKDSDEKYKIMCELATMTRRADRLEAKLKAVDDFIRKEKTKSHATVAISELEDVIRSGTQRFKAAAKIIAMAEKAKSADQDGAIKSAACIVM